MADILKPGTVDSGFKFLGGDPSSPTSWEPVGLKIGTLDEGYRFKGGDPNDQTSWEKAPERSYLGASAVSGGRTLLAAGAKLIEEFNPFTTSEQEAAVLYKDNPEKLQEFTEKSASAILSRFAQEQTRRAREAMEEVRPSEKGLISGQQLDKLEYATLDPEKAAYLSPTRVAGDVLQSLPTTIALAASAYLTKGRSATAFQQAEASALARGVAAEEAKQIARAEALKVAANTMATTGAVGEGAIGYAQQANQTLDEIKRMPDEEWEKSSEYKSLLDEGYSPESAKTLLGARAAEQAGALAGAVDAATNLIGGKVLGRVIGEGGKLGARTAKGFATEAATETVQSAGEQLGANIAMQRITPDLDLTKGVLEAAVAGGVVGGVTGGGVSAVFGSRQRPETDILKDLNNAKDVASTVAAANELAGSLDTLTAATTEYLAPPAAPALTPDESLELAAAKGAMERVGSLDLGAGPAVIAPAAETQAAADAALREVEAAGGVATPAQAAIIDAAFPGRQMYDSVAVAGEPTPTPAGTIEVPEIRVPRSTFVQGAAEAANTEGFAELQARQQATAAAAPVVETPAVVAPPAATSVIAAFATPGAQRTAEQRITLNNAAQAYSPEDVEVMQLAATAPFKLDATQKVRLQALRQETGPVLSPERTPQLMQALAVTPVMRTPEQQQIVSQARDSMPAEEFEALRVQAMEAPVVPEAVAPQAPVVPEAVTAGTVTPDFVAQMASTPERPFTAADVQVVDTNTLEGIEKQNFRLINQISRVFGKRVVVFDGLAGLKADGFVNPQDTNTIFLNRNSQMPHIAVFGHEMLHLLRRDSPDAYNAFASVVEKNLDEEGRSAFKAEYGETGEVLEELSADLMGNRFRDANFWTETFNEIAAQQGAPQARSVIAKLAGALYNAVDKAVAALRGQGFRADQYVKDLSQIKAAAKTALKTYAEQRRIPAMQMELEVAKASKTMDTVSKANTGATNEPTGIPSLLSPTRPDRSGLVGERGGEAAAIPEFGTDSGRAGSIRVQGVHYSHDQLASVDGNRYGSNVSKDRGAEAGRVRAAKDRRITKRGYFYINTGKGISPEEGVGSVAHTAVLGNMYDPATGVIKANDLNDFESAVLDAGFDGYINRERGMAVVLDDKQVPVISSDGTAEVVPAPKSETVTSQLVKMRSLPAGELSRERWGQVLKTVAPEIHAQLEPTGAFQGEERVYKNQLAPQLSRKREAIGDYEVSTQKDGGLTVYGNPDEIRALMPEGVVGRPTKTGVAFTGTVAPRVRAALEGRKLAYSRAGQVLEKRPIKDGKYVGAPEKYNTPGKLPKLLKQLRQLTQEGAAGRYWYENSGQEVLKMVGGDVNEARKFVALLAIYSPQAKVDANTTFALRAWAQYKAGQPISVKTESQDTKAQQALDDVDAFWSGEKTGNFFFNLLRQIDPTTEGKQGATIDMWMMRAAEYESDAPTGTQYAFMENETNAIARELGWEPQQVQAAIWVAMKARMENPGVKKRTEATSEKKGWIRYDYPVKNGRPVKTRVILDAQKHRDNWLKHAMAHDPSTDDTATAKFDFGDGLKRHLGQVSFEARPGRSTGVLPGIHDAPYEQQVEFQRDVQNALLEEDGSDRLAQLLGLMVDTNDIMLPGVWQGDVSPSSQKLVAMAPAKGAGGKSNVDPAQAEALNVYAAIRGLLAYQEGVGWHRPFFAGTKRDANGLDINLGRQMYPEEAKSLEGAISNWMQDNGKGADWADSFAIISSPNGVRLVSFGIIENGQLQSDIVSLAESVLPDFDYRVFASSGDMASNNWKENPNGESYIQRVSAAGRSDVLDWARAVLAPRVQSVFKDYSRRYGWGNPGSFDFVAERGAADQGRPSLSRRRGLESIFEGLNGRGLALARAQAAADAHPAAAQITFVQDNFYDILAQLEESGRVEINCD